MNLEMTIKKLGSVYIIRVGRATGNEHSFLFGPIPIVRQVSGSRSFSAWLAVPDLGNRISLSSFDNL